MRFWYFSGKMLVNRTRIHKRLVRIANREKIKHLKKQSDLGLHCFSRPFWQAISVQNFRTFLRMTGTYKINVYLQVTRWHA